MSKKPKSSRHRACLPPWHTPKTVVLDEQYEHEVEQASERLAAEFRRAEKRAQAADRRLAQAQLRAEALDAGRQAKRDLEKARQAAEQAWLEFRRLDAMIREAPHTTARAKVRRVNVAGSPPPTELEWYP